MMNNQTHDCATEAFLKLNQTRDGKRTIPPMVATTDGLLVCVQGVLAVIGDNWGIHITGRMFRFRDAREAQHVREFLNVLRALPA